MKRMNGFIVACFLLTSGCSPDSEADIVHDFEAQQHSDKLSNGGVASNTDLNHIKVKRSSTLEDYADYAGYYLRRTINRLEEISPYLEDYSLDEEEQRDALQIITAIQQDSTYLQEHAGPDEFNEFRDIQSSLLTELDALNRVLSDIRSPSHPSQVQNARVYYENAVMSHKLLETEYQTLAEELGFY